MKICIILQAFFLCVWGKTQVRPKLRFKPKLSFLMAKLRVLSHSNLIFAHRSRKIYTNHYIKDENLMRMPTFDKTQVQISPKLRFEGTKTQVQIAKTQVQIVETQVRVSLLRWGETKKRTIKKPEIRTKISPKYVLL